MKKLIEYIATPFRWLYGPTKIESDADQKRSNWIAAVRTYVYSVWPDVASAAVLAVIGIAENIDVTHGVGWYILARCLIALVNPVAEVKRRNKKYAGENGDDTSVGSDS